MKFNCVIVLTIGILASARDVSFAQDSGTETDRIITEIKARLNLTNPQTAEIRQLVDQQSSTLSSIFAGLANRKSADDPSVWELLLKNRRDFANKIRGLPNKDLASALAEAQARMEQDRLGKYRDQIAQALASDLGLNGSQVNSVPQILASDFEKKSALVNQYQSRDASTLTSFKQEVTAISQDSVGHVTAILSPDQVKKYNKLNAQSKLSRLGLWKAVASVGETAQSGSGPTDKSIATSQTGDTAKSKKGEFVVAPIPIVNPTLENGLGLAVGYLYRLDKTDKNSPPSMTGVGVFRTSNGSHGWAVLQKLNLKNDRYRITVAAGKINIHYNFFGIGNDAGNAGISIPIDQSGYGAKFDALFHIGGRWYLGPHYHFIRSTVGLDPINIRNSNRPPNPTRPTISDIELNLKTAAIGPHLQYDSTTNAFYPTSGSIFDTEVGIYGKAIGGRLKYQSYEMYYNKYISLKEHQVLAAHIAGCAVAGNPPFYDICTLGMSKDLRGYEAGRYRDRRMLATQAEYRLELPKRFGLVAFAGIGQVAPNFGAFRFDKILPAGGAGLRFRLTKENHVNLRIDYAIGKGSSAIYVSVGEAF